MNRERYTITMMCRLYGVTRDGFNAWRRRGKSKRALEDDILFQLIHEIFKRHDGNYGSPKITREIRKKGIPVGQKRVARLMSHHGLKATKARMYKRRPGTYKHIYGIPCRIADIELTGENQLWVGDVTYLKMLDGSWQYLAVIMDRYSRRIIGWSLSDRRDANLTCAALERAIRNRGHHEALIFHSDRGTEYLAEKYRRRLHCYGIDQSMNRVKRMNDNAFMESFFQQFKTERIKKQVLSTVAQVRAIVSEYMRYYNYDRSHSSIGYVSPNEFECKMNY